MLPTPFPECFQRRNEEAGHSSYWRELLDFLTMFSTLSWSLFPFQSPHQTPTPNRETLPQMDCYPHLINLPLINLPTSLAFLCRPSQAQGIQPAPLCPPTPHIHPYHTRRPVLSILGKASFYELSSPLMMNGRTTGCYARLYFFGAALPSLGTPTDILCVRHFNRHNNPIK